MKIFDNEKEKQECIQNWMKFLVLLVIALIVHNINLKVEEISKNPPPPAQTINSIKVSDIRVGSDLIDKLFRVVNLRGTAENISQNLKSNIVITVELQDRNGINIGTEEIKITSLAPSEKYKIDENVWNKEVKSYKVKSITTK